MKSLAKNLIRRSGFDLIRASTHDQLRQESQDLQALLDALAATPLLGNECRAQLKQDLFVLLETGFKTGGFFVEFGATNGVDLSNTCLLERRFGWRGILAEPARAWHSALRKNRTAVVETDCVWTRSGETLEFNMVNDLELSTISNFNDRDRHATRRQAGEVYPVKTVSLVDLLRRHQAPKVIDYLSIDTEGSEFDILNAFDFDAFDIRIITCEHNYTEDRERIHRLLTSKGYQRRYPGLSKWDDWYVRG